MGLRDTVDPLAGSYYIESLTNEMHDRIKETMDDVEKKGGIVEAIANGYIQREVARQAFLHEKGIQSGEIPKVGVNRYRIEEEKRQVEIHDYDAAKAEEQIRRLNKVRKERDADKVKETLEAIRRAAGSGENVMPSIIEAVKAYATVGEITAVFKEVFGEFDEPVRF